VGIITEGITTGGMIQEDMTGVIMGGVTEAVAMMEEEVDMMEVVEVMQVEAVMEVEGEAVEAAVEEVVEEEAVIDRIILALHLFQILRQVFLIK
jgi:hypothetical protein